VTTTVAATLTSTTSPEEQLAVSDVLLRFASGLDRKDEEMFRAVFAADAVLDFSPGGQTLGLDFPAIEGRDAIVPGILGAVGGLLTSHSVSNVRVAVTGDTAVVDALVEAQHVALPGRERHLLLKNRYDVRLRRESGAWLLTRVTIDTLWWTGAPALLTGED
jgi:hypothetical protein